MVEQIKKPPLSHRIISDRPRAAGFLCLEAPGNRSGVRTPSPSGTPSRRAEKGCFASFSRYFKITLPIISSLNFLSIFPAYFLENMKNTAFLCGVFRLHLFWRHRLARPKGLEPPIFRTGSGKAVCCRGGYRVAKCSGAQFNNLCILCATRD